MDLLKRAFGAAISCFSFLCQGGVFLVPNSAQDVFAVGEVSTVRAEDLKSDGAVVTDGLQRTDAMDGIDGASAQRQVKIGAAAFVIMQMDVLEAFPVGIEQFVGCIDIDQEVRVANVQMEREFRHAIHQFADLSDSIVGAGQIFDHQTNPEFTRERE